MIADTHHHFPASGLAGPGTQGLKHFLFQTPRIPRRDLRRSPPCWWPTSPLTPSSSYIRNQP
jgi:hypothetical protein